MHFFHDNWDVVGTQQALVGPIWSSAEPTWPVTFITSRCLYCGKIKSEEVSGHVTLEQVREKSRKPFVA